MRKFRFKDELIPFWWSKVEGQLSSDVVRPIPVNAISQKCLDGIFGPKVGTTTHSGTRMERIDFGCERSKVTVPSDIHIFGHYSTIGHHDNLRKNIWPLFRAKAQEALLDWSLEAYKCNKVIICSFHQDP